MSTKAKLEYDDKSYEMPIVEGSYAERAIDIRSLRKDTGLITLDSGFMNTGATESKITFINGEEGILLYRGYPIEQLAEHSSFIETSYLLIFGELPTQKQLDQFSHLLTYHSMLHEDMRHFFDGFPSNAHPMAILSSMVSALSAYYPDSIEPDSHNITHIARLLSKLRTIAAFSHQKTQGRPVAYPKNSLDYCGNFLYMMFSHPAEPTYVPDPELVKALNVLFILHADHEQNCSTSTVRLVGSSQANLYAAASAGVSALWGPLHGGANQAVIEMLKEIRDEGGDTSAFMQQVKNRERRLMGFGHRVYKNFDPRATILKKYADRLLNHLQIEDELFDIGRRLEEVALSDEYFIERKLYPNVDFYSGIIYRAMGIPTKMFTVMFALGRIPGWIAHWKEMMEDPDVRIGRPRQVYTGERRRDYTPCESRRKSLP
ncbi:MAG: citrate synthase [Deltaproteobacteria bacterium]|nr:citrate synthase [Deltaproteobacteria bacterium]NND29149.1 citrate synthase [Myxococcales bacterium]MBT8483810.1 citrate synthase [Deltaproteobacteria bacterium]NNK44449.1 citrate synthase [Myxococcales bacterium]NNL26668.1 citrate synthase [Myxococcales bacterium]